MFWDLVVAGLCLGVGDQPAAKDTQSAPAVVVEHTNVIDTKTGEVTRDCDVVLRGDRIGSIGSKADSAKKRGAQVFNASGCMPGFSLHDELGLLVGAGLSPLEALQGATYHAAVYLRLEDRYGTVSPGKAADLIVLDANPLEDIHNSSKIHAVIQNGKVLHRSEVDRQLAAIEKKASGK
jgi:adenine deaminase